MARVQLALNVTDLDAAVDFYSALFQVPVHKKRPGYANFVVTDPPLKLALFEVTDRGHGVVGALNHIGVEVLEESHVGSADGRLSAAGLELRRDPSVVCCHAEQNKIWLDDPDGLEWEIYAVTDDAPDGLPLTSTQDCCTT